MSNYLYLWLDLGTLLGPLLLSFDKRVAFFRRWKALFPAIVLTALLFLIWDIWFTDIGVWGFNEEYLVGWSLFGLPLEEWLFFFVVPYACLFIYDCLISYLPVPADVRWARIWTQGLAAVLLIVGIIYWDHWYTAITFIGGSFLLLLNLYAFPTPYLGRFWFGYAVSLIPFLLVNGVLTALPIVWYNDAENLAIRIGTIPLEDTMYLMWLLLMSTNLYEYFQTRLLRPTTAKRYA